MRASETRTDCHPGRNRFANESLNRRSRGGFTVSSAGMTANIDEPSRLVDFVASSLPFLTTNDKQQMLETAEIVERLDLLNKHLAKEIEVQQLRAKIQTEVQDQVQQSQRDYYLREQMKAIQKELGEQDDGQRETDELRQKIDAAGMPEDVKKEAMKELTRLSRMSPID